MAENQGFRTLWGGKADIMKWLSRVCYSTAHRLTHTILSAAGNSGLKRVKGLKRTRTYERTAGRTRKGDIKVKEKS